MVRRGPPGCHPLPFSPCETRVRRTDALSSVVQRDTTIHLSIGAKVVTGFELGTSSNARTSCIYNRAGLPAQRTQLRRDWSLLDQMARRNLTPGGIVSPA